MTTALVIGYGSIGSRHARILKQLGCNVVICSNRHIEGEKVYPDLWEAYQSEQPVYIVISNETNQHIATFLQLIAMNYSGKLLIEKPLFKQWEQLPDHKMHSVHVAYNLRLHPVILELRKLLSTRKVISVTIHSGQYMPNWRPGIDYRNCYSSSKQAGGGVLRDLSHELDYAIWLFGDWITLVADGGHFSQLEINSDDTYSILMKTTRCESVSIHLNYLDRISQRKIVINTAQDTIIGDLIRNTIQINDQFMEFEVDRDDTYVKQHLKILTEDTNELCTLNEGMEVVHLIDSIEQSSALKKWIINH